MSPPEPALPARSLRYRWWLALAVCSLLVAVVLLPRLISSRWVYQPMLERLRAGEFGLAVDAVDLYWFRPIQLHGITIAQIDREGALGGDRPPLVQVEHIGTDRGLLGYLFSGRELGRLEIEQPAVDFELLREDGSLRELLRALGGEAGPARRERGPLPVNVAVRVRDARIVIRQAGRTDPLVIVPPFDLEVAYGVRDDESWLHIEPTTVLNHVALTPELMQMGLEYVVPVLARAAWLSGEVSADLGPVDIPLARPVEAMGTATVTFHNVHAGLSEPALEAGVRRIAMLLGREPTNELVLVDGSVVEVRMADSVIHHQGMRIGLPRVDPRLQMASEGAVSLADRSLDLVLSIPIPVDLVARRDAVRELGVPMVRLPVQGVLGSPELRWSQLRGDSAEILAAIGGQLAEDAPLRSAIIGALSDVTGGEADEAIRWTARALLELRERVQRQREARTSTDAVPSDPPQLDDPEVSPGRRRPILDRLRLRLQREDDAP